MSRETSLAILLAGLCARGALAQADLKMQAPEGERLPPWIAVQVSDPDDPKVKAYAARQKVRVQLEREMNKIRADYFRAKRTDIRQAGIMKLRTYNDPVIYPSLLKLFLHDGNDVRFAMLDHLAQQQNDEADTVIAWGAIFDLDPKFRGAATQRLLTRLNETGAVSGRIQTVIAEGLRRNANDEVTAAAKLAQTLHLVEAIPMLINAQIQGSQVAGSSGGDGDDHSLAWIEVGTQQAFVADLTPVVGNSAVAFDPKIGVVTEGVVLRVIDANVVTYRTEVHNSLIGLSSAAWGRPTEQLGWDNAAWDRWYIDEFKPYWAAKMAKEKAEAKAKADSHPAAPTAPPPADAPPPPPSKG